ncbi:pyrroline-5-carboxylate reductase [Rhodospirillaceae bacterium SYSU D60014]|uniref:pyrroline-5-carboxylate reductase n=1 Tax=Virgifigura deserti TaxID=2268457 RepID=UPI000E673EBB
MNLSGPLLLVGSGKMGGAMLRGWLDRGLPPSDIAVVEPNPAALGDLASAGLRILPDAAAVPADLWPAVVVLAVKPQMMGGVLPAYARFARPETVFLSVAAGKTIAYFERHFGAGTPIVRAMPNTPAAVGRGITALSANGAVTAAQRDACSTLLSAVGEVAWVEAEALLDAVTAVSGGGPAYVFLMIECLAEAGVQAGLPPDLAMRLARSTVAGAGELACRSDDPVSILRQNVTSPGGTTIEALSILMAPDGMQVLFTKAIAAATRRSRELAD